MKNSYPSFCCFTGQFSVDHIHFSLTCTQFLMMTKQKENSRKAGRPSCQVWDNENCETGFYWGYPSTLLHPGLPQRDAASTMLHCWSGIGEMMSGEFHHNITLKIEAKQFKLCFIRPKNLVSHRLLNLNYYSISTQDLCSTVRVTDRFLFSSFTNIQLLTDF